MAKTGRRTVIGVMGGAVVEDKALRDAEELGTLIAKAGYVLLTGGRPVGVMEAAGRGAKKADGLVIGVLPGGDPAHASTYVDIAVATGLSDARNLVNVLSSDVVVACPGGCGTLSEVALAVKNSRPVVLLDFDPGPVVTRMGQNGKVRQARNAVDAMKYIRFFLGDHSE